MSEIVYTDKTNRRTSTTPESQKVTAANMNEIKASVNALYVSEILKTNRVLTSAEILALNTTPIELIAAPGAGKMIQLISYAAFLDFNSVAYATNLAFRIIYAGSSEVIVQANSSFINATGDANLLLSPLEAQTQAAEDQMNKAVQAFINTGDPTAGNSDIKTQILYTIVDFTAIT